MYKRTIWQDHVEGVQEGTDLNAANLNNIEVGTMEANALAALHASYRRYENDVVKDLVVTTYPEDGGYYIVNGEEGRIPVLRNNANYRIEPEVIGRKSESTSAPNFIITKKTAASFTVKQTNTEVGDVEVVFHVSGGMT